jgi:hypothetical protein
MWAVPVAVRASMTEAIQLTNANASVDSAIVAAAPARPTTTNRPMAEAQSSSIESARGGTSTAAVEQSRAIAAEPARPPAAPVAEPTSVTPSVAGGGVARSTPTRANTSGFILGLSLNGSSIRFDDASSSIESGGGLSAQIGWGFTRNFALLLDVSGAAISSDGGDYGLGNAEISGRWHFASPTRALVPFLEVGFAERAVVQNDVVYFDDFGNSLAGDFSLLGSAVAFGGGLQYHVSPTMALGGSLKWTVGSFSTVKLDNVSVDGLDISATTARVNLGFTWYPVMGGIR